MTARIAVLALCTALVGSPSPDRQGESTTLRGWYAEVEACSGLHRDFDQIVWSMRGEPERQSEVVVIGHFAPPNSLWVAETELNEKVVKHEMMHYLLGSAGHPSPPFGFCVTRYGKE